MGRMKEGGRDVVAGENDSHREAVGEIENVRVKPGKGTRSGRVTER